MEIKIRRSKSSNTFHVIIKAFGDPNFHPFILPEHKAHEDLDIDTLSIYDINNIAPSQNYSHTHYKCIFYDELRLVSLSAKDLQLTIDRVIGNIKSNYQDYTFKKDCEQRWDKGLGEYIEDEIIKLE